MSIRARFFSAIGAAEINVTTPDAGRDNVFASRTGPDCPEHEEDDLPESVSSREGSDFSGRSRRVHRKHAETVCKSLGIPSSTLTKFADLPDIPMMLIDIKGHLIENDKRKSSNELIDLLVKESYKTMLTERLTMVLISPNLTAYRVGLGEQVMKMIKRIPDVFKTPAAMFHDPEAQSKLQQLVESILTQRRSAIKSKIAKHMHSKAPIHELTKNVAPRNVELSVPHYTRVAFLRACYSEYNGSGNNSRPDAENNGAGSNANDNGTNDANDNSANLNANGNGTNNANGNDMNNNAPPVLPTDDDVDKSTRKDSQFWRYVDTELRSLREYARNNDAHLPTEEALQRFFNVTLMDDIVKYRGKVTETEVENTDIRMPAGNMVEKPAWQDAIENAAVW
ncbi:hypothetical protein F5887DRAFT_1076593 [Amanita rubescens]|nr:hypothetical protein F5887DRAFT_1076593 [Amanita rubescens]